MRFIVLILMVTLAPTCRCQTILLSAGDSSLFQSSGGNAKIYMPDGSVENFSVGNINSGPTMYGGNISKPFDGFTATAGDMSLPFNLSTDSFLGYGFLARGFSIAPSKIPPSLLRTSAPIAGSFIGRFAGAVDHILNHCRLFAGVSSVGYATPFFLASRSSDPLGYVSCEDRLNDRWTLGEKDAFSDRQTILTSVSWSNDGLTLAATGGVGNNSPYGAALAKYENASRTLSLQASYITANDQFRRVLVTSPLLSENIGFNANGTWLITKSLRATAQHQHLLSPVRNLPSITATMNSESLFYQLGRMNFHASNYSSTALGVKNSGQDYGSEIRLVNGISFREEYLRSKNSDVFISSVRERFLHLEFTENYSRTTTTYSGTPLSTNSFDGGVTYRGNGLTASAEFEEAYFPFVPAGHSPFERILTISISKTVHDAVTTVQTYVTPQNHLRWTISGSDYIYGKPVENGRHIQARHSIDKYIVHGILQDQNKKPVYGGVIQVDGQIVYTGLDGEFSLRFRRPGTFPVRVCTQDFLEGTNWSVVSAPSVATAKLEESADYLVITVRRL